MTIMDGFKLGFGLYAGYSLCKGINIGLGRWLEESSLYKKYVMPYENKAKHQEAERKATPKNPVGFGHTYD